MAGSGGSGESNSQRSRKGNSGRQRRRSESAAVPEERPRDDNDEPRLKLDEEDNNYGATSETQTQQLMISQLLDRTRSINAQTSKRLKTQIDELFDGSESKVDAIVEEHFKEVESRLDSLKATAQETKLLHAKTHQYKMEVLERQLLSITQADLALQKVIKDDDIRRLPEKYLAERQLHSVKLTRRAAKKALERKERDKEEAKIYANAKAFADSHRTLFKNLCGSKSVME